MRKSILVLAAALVLAQPCLVWGTLLPASPNPADLNDLSHDTLWTWRLDNIWFAGAPVTSATLSIKNIYNWREEPNRLFIHLFDTVPNAGTASRRDTAAGIQDYFLNPHPGFAPASGASNILLAAPSFAGGYSNRTNYVYTFTPSQLTILSAFIANGGDVAFGFDPDCHFYNSGITFDATHAPEPSTMILAGAGLLVAAIVLRRMRRRQAGQ